MTATTPGVFHPPSQYVAKLPDEIAMRLRPWVPGIEIDHETDDVFVRDPRGGYVHWPSVINTDAPDHLEQAAAAAVRYRALGGVPAATAARSAQTFDGPIVEGQPVRLTGNIAGPVRHGAETIAEEVFSPGIEITWNDPPLVLTHNQPLSVVGQFVRAEYLPGVPGGPLCTWRLASDLPDELQRHIDSGPPLSVSFTLPKGGGGYRDEPLRSGGVRRHLTAIAVQHVAIVDRAAYGTARLHKRSY